MEENQIKELFYSNGFDIFGPVSFEEFNNFRYYSSTMVWYQGLSKWMKIGDCNELKHLIGTLNAPDINSSVPHASADQTPPLSNENFERRNIYNISFKTLAIIVIVLLCVSSLLLVKTQLIKTQKNQNAMASITSSDSGSLNNIAAETEKKTYRNHWRQCILAIPNDYNKNELGGIKDLKVILKNTTPYMLDSVKVKLDFVKANDDIFQTEYLVFENLNGSMDKALFAPNSKRGVKVKCSIVSIYSKALNMCYNVVDKQPNAMDQNDPFLCK